MKRDELRKVEVFEEVNHKQRVLYVGYFHGFYTETYNNDSSRSSRLKAIIELESGEIGTESIYDVRFIS